MRCVGDVLATQINKSALPLQYKFLSLVLIQCLGKRKAGYDMANTGILTMMTALTINKDFNFSRMIFENMKENIEQTTRKSYKFWMYLRFVQMFIDSQLEGLVKASDDILPIDSMNEGTLTIVKRMSKYKEGRVPRKMIGHLGNPLYVTPADVKWRHPESDSDDDDLLIDALIEQKRKDVEAGVSKKGKGKTVSIDEGDDDAGEDDTKDDNEDDKDEDDDDNKSDSKKKWKRATGTKKAKRVRSDQVLVEDLVIVQPTEVPESAKHTFTEEEISEILQSALPQSPPVVQEPTVAAVLTQSEQTIPMAAPTETTATQGSSQPPRRKTGA
ncbi:hypothetical protein HanPI659440_Chr03g0099381 [Helianthus annuus]|nr:hypothetical protein HanPI659440_Chr03g0099381 [Helianthus annuus]